MRKLLLCLLISSVSHARDDWFCSQESGKRDGAVIWSCGIGDGLDESTAREKALNAAFREFEAICENSSDCQGRPRTVNPQRTSCRHDSRGFFTCTRLIVTTLGKQ
jgi:hypothetical protein